MKVAVWSPLPPASSGIADYSAELLPALARHHEVLAVVDDPAAVEPTALSGVPVVGHRSPPETDIDVYQIGNSPAQVFVYRAALARPGVVVLHEWGLHDLVWSEAEDRGDFSRYLAEMRRSGGEAGSFVGRQVLRGLGGRALPALFAANDGLIERSLGVATLTREAGARAARRFPWVPHLQLPSHLTLPGSPVPTHAEARRTLAHGGLESAAARLSDFLVEVQGQRSRLLRQIEADTALEGTLAGYFVEEVRRAKKDLGLGGLRLDLKPLLAPLAGRRPTTLADAPD